MANLFACFFANILRVIISGIRKILVLFYIGIQINAVFLFAPNDIARIFQMNYHGAWQTGQILCMCHCVSTYLSTLYCISIHFMVLTDKIPIWIFDISLHGEICMVCANNTNLIILSKDTQIMCICNNTNSHPIMLFIKQSAYEMTRNPHWKRLLSFKIQLYTIQIDFSAPNFDR